MLLGVVGALAGLAAGCAVRVLAGVELPAGPGELVDEILRSWFGFEWVFKLVQALFQDARARLGGITSAEVCWYMFMVQWAFVLYFRFTRGDARKTPFAATIDGWTGRNRTKDALRQNVWDALAASGEARDADGPYHRIPDFAGAEAAAAHLRRLPAWREAAVVKCNPDPPQAFVRRNALEDGKRLYVPVPCLTYDFPFLLLDPAALAAAGLAPSDVMYAEGAMAHGTRVEFSEMEPMDVCVVGSVAVTRAGGRTGKGGGFADLELGLFRHYGTCNPGVTPVVSTVHALQVVADGDVVMEEHDTPLDLIVTPDGVTPTQTKYAQPGKLDWGKLQPDQYESIPFLKTLRAELECK